MLNTIKTDIVEDMIKEKLPDYFVFCCIDTRYLMLKIEMVKMLQNNTSETIGITRNLSSIKSYEDILNEVLAKAGKE